MPKVRLDNGQEIKLHRAFIGIGWPGDRSGHVCVVGEELRPEWDSKTGSTITYLFYRYVCESQSADLHTLITKTLEFRSHYKTVGTYAKRSPAVDHYVTEFNRQAMSARGPSFFYSEPPGIPAGHESDRRGIPLNYYVELIRDLLRDQVLVKSDLEPFLIHRRLLECPSNLVGVTDIKHPAVFSLGAAIAALRLMPSRDMLIEEDRQAEILVDQYCYEG